MNNEPVAWMDYKGYLLDSEDVETYQKEGLVCTPLYIHPAKTLTDEEILKVIKKHESINGNIDTYDVLACVKEILRKTQEK
jgi:hypothetical protein